MDGAMAGWAEHGEVVFRGLTRHAFGVSQRDDVMGVVTLENGEFNLNTDEI